jgi:ketosteroid isomerase-like protein
MSQENVEIVRRAWEALDRGDVEAALRDAAPDAEFDQTRAIGMDRGVYTRDEFRRLTEAFIATWELARWEAEEFIDAGEHVVMSFTNRMTGRDGIEVQARGTLLWTLRAGKVVRVRLYQKRREALEAAGLSE